MMAKTDLETLKERIMERYDPEYLCDILRISTEDLLEAFEDRLEGAEFSELDDEDIE